MQPESYVTFRLHRCFIPWRIAPAKELPGCMLITRGFGQHMISRINLLLQAPRIQDRKGGDIMLKINPLSTLYVGIDVSSKSNYVCALDFYKNKYINSSFVNNQPGAEELAQKILECIKKHPDLNTVVALESTSVYSIHIANYLSRFL